MRKKYAWASSFISELDWLDYHQRLDDRSSVIKGKGRISKRVFRENEARQIFRKNKHFLPPDTHTYVCASGVKGCSFFVKFLVLCFLETLVLRFALLLYY